MYALKRVKIGEMSKREVDDALSEIRFLASIRHKNIVGFLESYTGMTLASCYTDVM
jgi:serine/threonine protein kinase